MSWKAIANTVGKIAPTLGSLLGGRAGESIGTLIATTLGVENTPEGVSEALRINPEAAVKLAEIESNQKIKLQELQIDLAKAELQSETQNMTDINTTMQAEGKSEHFLTYSWRPLIGYSVAIASIGGVVITITAYVAALCGRPEGLTNLPMVLGALAGLNLTSMPVLGVASYFRGKAQHESLVSSPAIPFSPKG